MKKWSDSSTIPDWSETPFRLSSANVRPEFLGISELREYLHFNADFPETLLAPFRTQLQYRWALPWTCFVVDDHGDAARDRLLPSRHSLERGGGDRTRLYDEFPDPPVSRARGRGSGFALRRGLDAKPDFPRGRHLICCTCARPIARRPALIRSRSGVACARHESFGRRMVDSASRRSRARSPGEPFVCGREFLHAALSRRRRLSPPGLERRSLAAAERESAAVFLLALSFRAAAPPSRPSRLPKENAEELFRRLVAAADRANANACYVLAAMLERKRILKQIQTESEIRPCPHLRAPRRPVTSLLCLIRNSGWTNWKGCRREVMGLMTNAE